MLAEDKNARIVIDNIESNISPKPIANPDNDTLAVTAWDDEYVIDFDKETYPVEEGENVELKLIIRGVDQSSRVSNFGLETTTKVMFRYLDFAVRAGIDYAPRYSNPDFLTIPPSTTSFIIEIQTLPDELQEGNESFRILIDRDPVPQMLINGSLFNIFTSSADVVIIDDDAIRVTITARRSVIAGTMATFTVARTTPFIESGLVAQPILIPSLNSTLTMALEARETNDEGRDYVPSVSQTTAVIGMVTIPAGERKAIYSIPTVDDGVGRSSSRLTVSIDDDSFTSSGEDLDVILGTPSSASLSVVPPRAVIYIRSKVFLEGALQ